MAARLVIYARWIALVVLVLAIALIIARWKLPMREHRTRSGGTLDLWRNLWAAWQQNRREAAERARNLRNLRGRKALIVGPEHKSLRSIHWRLQSLRCGAQSTRTGARGIAAARAQSPDLIIADALLPDMSAEDFLRSLGDTQAAIILVGATVHQRDGLCQQRRNVACLGASFDPDEVAVIAGRLLEHLTS